MDLLRQLLTIQSPCGAELTMRDFIIDYIKKNKKDFASKPTIYYGEQFQNCLAICFGKPKVAVFAHMDTVGYMVRYGKELIPLGSPYARPGTVLVGKDSQGEIECTLTNEGEESTYEYTRDIDRGTELSYKPLIVEDDNMIQSPYLDNRVGLWTALKLAEGLKDGLLIFTTLEEHRGGTAQAMAGWMLKKFKVRKALISDVTWVTNGVHHGEGVVISLRDRDIPNRAYFNKVVEIAKDADIQFQIEVEGSGSSDGGVIQHSPYFIDWCFVGAPYSNIHQPDERVFKNDLASMLALYRKLMKKI